MNDRRDRWFNFSIPIGSGNTFAINRVLHNLFSNNPNTRQSNLVPYLPAGGDIWNISINKVGPSIYLNNVSGWLLTSWIIVEDITETNKEFIIIRGNQHDPSCDLAVAVIPYKYSIVRFFVPVDKITLILSEIENNGLLNFIRRDSTIFRVYGIALDTFRIAYYKSGRTYLTFDGKRTNLVNNNIRKLISSREYKIVLPNYINSLGQFSDSWWKAYNFLSESPCLVFKTEGDLSSYLKNMTLEVDKKAPIRYLVPIRPKIVKNPEGG